MAEQLRRGFYDEIVRAALREDIGAGDVTTDATISHQAVARAVIRAKQPGVICGLEVAQLVYANVGPIKWIDRLCDGDPFAPGQTLAGIEGPARAILSGERVALNFLQRLSGIATLTRKFVDAVQGTKVRIADTRKTTPGLRALEKYAVRVGGGVNHRFGLYDAVLIKDNHIAAAGGITVAVERVRQRAGFMMKVEVETRSLAEAEEALTAGVEVIMLDNMTIDQMGEAVQLISGRALVEASGNVTLDNVHAIAETGVDIISVGALTHSAPALDLSLQLVT